MKVLFIAHDSLRGGSGCCFFELLQQIKKDDDVTPIVLCHNKNTLSEGLKKIGIETYCCRFGYTYAKTSNILSYFFWGVIYRYLANCLAYLYLMLKIDLKSVDVIHSNSGIIDFGAFLHRRIKKPLVWHLRELERLVYVPVIPNFVKYLNQNSREIITVSNDLKNHFIKIGANRECIQCVYDGVIGSRFAMDIEKNNSKYLKICMVGRLCPEKGQIMALEALRKLPKRLLDRIRLDFYGYGVQEAQLKKTVKDWELENTVHFMGFCSDLNEKIGGYDIGLNLSKVEGFGRTTVEYMLEELYVIAINGGATPEILNYGEYGSLIDDSTDLAEELTKIIDNRDYYQKIAKNGRNYALRMFDIEKNYKNILSVIKKAAE